MKVYVDQSGKIEDTAKPTVVAFSNSKNYAVKVSPRVKRQLQEIFRRRGKIRLFVFRAFAALVFLLIKDNLLANDIVVIDTEYPGHEKTIKDMILEMLRVHKLPVPTIHFKRIGNRPKAHYAAYNVFTGKKKGNRTVNLEVLVNLTIKKDRGLKRLKNA